MKTWVKVTLGVLGALVVIGILAPDQSAPPVEKTEAAASPQPEAVNMATFQAIQTGMPLADVEKMIGPGELQSENDIAGIKTQMFQWNAGAAGLNLIVQDGKVTQKSQLGLK